MSPAAVGAKNETCTSSASDKARRKTLKKEAQPPAAGSSGADEGRNSNGAQKEREEQVTQSEPRHPMEFSEVFSFFEVFVIVVKAHQKEKVKGTSTSCPFPSRALVWMPARDNIKAGSKMLK